MLTPLVRASAGEQRLLFLAAEDLDFFGIESALRNFLEGGAVAQPTLQHLTIIADEIAVSIARLAWYPCLLYTGLALRLGPKDAHDIALLHQSFEGPDHRSPRQPGHLRYVCISSRNQRGVA